MTPAKGAAALDASRGQPPLPWSIAVREEGQGTGLGLPAGAFARPRGASCSKVESGGFWARAKRWATPCGHETLKKEMGKGGQTGLWKKERKMPRFFSAPAANRPLYPFGVTKRFGPGLGVALTGPTARAAARAAPPGPTEKAGGRAGWESRREEEGAGASREGREAGTAGAHRPATRSRRVARSPAAPPPGRGAHGARGARGPLWTPGGSEGLQLGQSTRGTWAERDEAPASRVPAREAREPRPHGAPSLGRGRRGEHWAGPSDPATLRDSSRAREWR